MLRPRLRPALTLVMAALVAGCAAGPAPETSTPPPATQPAPEPAPDPGFSRIVSDGVSDTVGSLPGAPDAPYRFRFRQIEPASDRFAFQDRDLSFHFRPAPDALYFQVENRQNRPVWIEWERSVFFDPNGSTGGVAHNTTTWDDRFRSQASTQIPGLQRYGDYTLPMTYLLDPAGSAQTPRRPLLPEDSTSPQYEDRIFGVDLVFLVEDRPRTYKFRFKVASVIKRS